MEAVGIEEVAGVLEGRRDVRGREPLVVAESPVELEPSRREGGRAVLARGHPRHREQERRGAARGGRRRERRQRLEDLVDADDGPGAQVVRAAEDDDDSRRISLGEVGVDDFSLGHRHRRLAAGARRLDGVLPLAAFLVQELL